MFPKRAPAKRQKDGGFFPAGLSAAEPVSKQQPRQKGRKGAPQQKKKVGAVLSGWMLRRCGEAAVILPALLGTLLFGGPLFRLARFFRRAGRAAAGRAFARIGRVLLRGSRRLACRIHRAARHLTGVKRLLGGSRPALPHAGILPGCRQQRQGARHPPAFPGPRGRARRR